MSEPRHIRASHLDAALSEDLARAADERWRREDAARRAATALPAPPPAPPPTDSPRRNRPKPRPPAKPKPPAKASESPRLAAAAVATVPTGGLILSAAEVETLKDIIDTHPRYSPRRPRP